MRNLIIDTIAAILATCTPKPYKDTVGKLTIGVGRNLDDVGIGEEEAEVLLRNDIKDAVSPNSLDLSLESWLQRTLVSGDVKQCRIELDERTLDRSVFGVTLDTSGDRIA